MALKRAAFLGSGVICGSDNKRSAYHLDLQWYVHFAQSRKRFTTRVRQLGRRVRRACGCRPVQSLFRKVLFGWPLKAAFSLGLILLLASTLSWRRVAELLLATDKLHLIAAFAVLALTPPLTAERWRNAAVASSVLLSRRFFLRATYAAVFAGQFLPASIGVDAARLALLWQQKLPTSSRASVHCGRQACRRDRNSHPHVRRHPVRTQPIAPGAAFPMIGMTIMLAAGCGSLLFIDRLPSPERFRSGWAAAAYLGGRY